jgi:hypothetical protein
MLAIACRSWLEELKRRMASFVKSRPFAEKRKDGAPGKDGTLIGLMLPAGNSGPSAARALPFEKGMLRSG